jgi:hypothetical protein
MPEPREPEEEGGGLVWRFPEGYSAEELPKALPELLRRVQAEPPAGRLGPDERPGHDHREDVRWLGDIPPPGLYKVPPVGGSEPLGDDTIVHYTRSTFGDAATVDEQSVIDALPVFARGLPPAEEVMGLALRLEDELLADHQVVEAGGRWRPRTYDPEAFLPGDVLALRYFSLIPSMRRVDSIIAALGSGRWKPGDQDGIDLFWHCRTILSHVNRVQHAASYYLPVQSAQAILASTPPDAELMASIRLPFPAVTVYFGADLEIPPAFQRWSEHLDTSRAQTSRLLEQITDPAYPDPYLPGFGAQPPGTPHQARRDLTQAMRDLGGYLSGVTLLAEEDGSLADQVLWTVATNLDPALADTDLRYDRMRGIIDGYLPASTLAPLAWNLAAAVCWGAWSPPPPPPQLPPADAGKAWRKAWKHSATKKAERRGALAGVRVINLARMTAPTARPKPGEGPHRASPRPHMRRGHWRRSRVGPREGWHYEGRWIAGRMVSLTGGTPEQPGRVVYRLPVPEGTPGAEALDKKEE